MGEVEKKEEGKAVRGELMRTPRRRMRRRMSDVEKAVVVVAEEEEEEKEATILVSKVCIYTSSYVE